MDKEKIRKEIEAVWNKHATGRANMICVYLPHANQKAFINDLIRVYEELADPMNVIEEHKVDDVKPEELQD